MHILRIRRRTILHLSEVISKASMLANPTLSMNPNGSGSALLPSKPTRRYRPHLGDLFRILPKIARTSQLKRTLFGSLSMHRYFSGKASHLASTTSISCFFRSIVERCMEFSSTAEERNRLRKDIIAWYDEYEAYVRLFLHLGPTESQYVGLLSIQERATSDMPTYRSCLAASRGPDRELRPPLVLLVLGHGALLWPAGAECQVPKVSVRISKSEDLRSCSDHRCNPHV